RPAPGLRPVARRSARALRSVRQARQAPDEQADAETRGSPGGVRKVLLGEGRAGDVEMGPARAPDELLEKEARDDRAGGVAADVLQVRDRALQILAVLN